MDEPKISIIVPIYKTEKYLTRCVDSLREQTLKEIEIILVDDGSPDNSPELCDKLAALDSRIKVIHKKNEGAGLSRNAGLEVAEGEYIGFVDSDDYVEKDMYEKLYLAAEKYDVELVLSGNCFVGGNVFGKDGEREDRPYFTKDKLFITEEDKKNLMLGIVGALPSEPYDSKYGNSVWKNLFKKDVIKENGIKFMSEREIMSEDSLFMLDYIAVIKNAVGIPGTFYCYCRNEDSISKSHNIKRFEKFLIFIKEAEKRISDRVSPDVYKIYFYRYIQSFVRVLCSQEIMYSKDNKIGFYSFRKNLKTICTHKVVREALKHYPWYRLPLKQAVFAFLIKYRLYFLQKIVVLLRDK